MRSSLPVLFTLLIAACTPTADPQPGATAPNGTVSVPPGVAAEVVHVFDGDSFIARLESGAEIEVRLLGINAPEGDECHGDAARRALEDALRTTPLTLVGDAADSDRFDRVLRYVYAGGTDVNLNLVADGHALAIQVDHSRADEFTTTGDAAVAAGKGMWAESACGSLPPLPPVEIAGYEFDPPGRDGDNPNGEWIAIANRGDQPVDLSGWTLRDESTQNRFRFEDGTTLESGAEMLVHSGCGDPTAGDLYWCAPDPVWSNRGDTIILQQTDGTVVSRRRYDGHQ